MSTRENIRLIARAPFGQNDADCSRNAKSVVETNRSAKFVVEAYWNIHDRHLTATVLTC